MNDMGYTYYGFRNCIGAFVEMPTADARKLLPPHLQPLEVQHTRSVLAVTAFEFTESSVGEYDEIVLAVIVPPMVVAGETLPNAAFFPFMVGTSTEAARLHAIERWHLPHYMKDVQMEFTPSDGEISLTVKDDGAPILDMVVSEYGFDPVKYLYNAFTVDGDDRFKANIHMEAPHSEHEEERGSLTLYEHEMTAGLTLDDVNTVPFREQWYLEGLQTFEPLHTI
jgi:Acetoacetate decarboxylase (ADC)